MSVEQWRHHLEPVRDAGHALELLDDVNSIVNFCAAYMPDADRYYRGAEAMWRVVYWIAAMPPVKEAPDPASGD